MPVFVPSGLMTGVIGLPSLIRAPLPAPSPRACPFPPIRSGAHPSPPIVYSTPHMARAYSGTFPCALTILSLSGGAGWSVYLQVVPPYTEGPLGQRRRSVGSTAQVSGVNGAGQFLRWGPAPLKRLGWRFLAQVSRAKSDLRHPCYRPAPLGLQTCAIHPIDLHHGLPVSVPNAARGRVAPSFSCRKSDLRHWAYRPVPSDGRGTIQFNGWLLTIQLLKKNRRRIAKENEVL